MHKSILKRALFVLCISIFGAQVSVADEEIIEFPITGAGDIVSSSWASIDPQSPSALLVDANAKTEVELFEVDGKDLGDKKLVYSARLRTENLTATDGTRGIAYLRMRVLFPDGEELIARGPRVPLSDTTDWRSGNTVLYVDKGGDPQSINLDLVVDGAGKVWIEDVKLLHRQLRTDYLLWGHAVVWIVLIIYIYHLVRKQSRLRRELNSLKGRT